MYKIVEYMDKYNEEINEFVISIYVEEHGFEEHRELIKNEDVSKSHAEFLSYVLNDYYNEK